MLPRVLGSERGGRGARPGPVPSSGPAAGDNAGAALGLGLALGRRFVSLGTSGVGLRVSRGAESDLTGAVAGFADASGHFLPLACTLNGSRVLDATARLLGVDHDELSRLALSRPSRARTASSGAVPRGRAHAEPARPRPAPCTA